MHYVQARNARIYEGLHISQKRHVREYIKLPCYPRRNFKES